MPLSASTTSTEPDADFSAVEKSLTINPGGFALTVGNLNVADAGALTFSGGTGTADNVTNAGTLTLSNITLNSSANLVNNANLTLTSSTVNTDILLNAAQAKINLSGTTVVGDLLLAASIHLTNHITLSSSSLTENYALTEGYLPGLQSYKADENDYYKVHIPGQSIDNGTPIDVFGSAGNDTIKNSKDGATITAGAGHDSICNTGDNVRIPAGDQNDTIDTYGDSVTVDGGAQGDRILGNQYNLSLMGGEGNDEIFSNGNNSIAAAKATTPSTITATLMLTFSRAAMTSSKISVSAIPLLPRVWSGRATEPLSPSPKTARPSAQSPSAPASKPRTIVSRAQDVRLSEIITNSENDTLITVTDTNAQIKNTGSNVTISTGALDDSINVYGDNVSVDAGAGDDEISNRHQRHNARRRG